MLIMNPAFHNTGADGVFLDGALMLTIVTLTSANEQQWFSQAHYRYIQLFCELFCSSHLWLELSKRHK